MDSNAQAILLYQIINALWLAFVVGSLYLQVHHEPFLKYWSMSWAAVAGGFTGGFVFVVLSAGQSASPAALTALAAGNLAAFLHPALLVLAALSIGRRPPSRLTSLAIVAAFVGLAVFLLLYTGREVTESMALLRALRGPRYLLSGAATIAFAVAFWRGHPMSRTGGGRVAVIASVLYAAHLAATAASEAGLPLGWGMASSLGPALGGFLPLGITAGLFVSVLQDTVAANKAVRESQERLRQAETLESVGRLAGGVAHDFNNLLTVINGFADLLLEQLPEDDDSRMEVTQIKNAGERAASLTRQLLAFSRKQVLEPKTVCLNEVVAGEEQILRRLIREDLDLRIVLDPSAGSVLADQHQLSQVLINLVLNARDALPGGGSITIETSSLIWDAARSPAHLDMPSGCYAVVSVTDTGVGMDQATRERIFEPFFTTKRLDHGTGLGLASVYGIVRQSGGWIWVDSEPAQGSTFKVYLPQIAVQGEASSASQPSSVSERGTETILLVEDQPEVRQFEASALESRGYRVLQAGNGAEALAVSAQFREALHLLLTDLVMPGINGYELAKQLEATRPTMKVLYLSGYTADAIAHQGILHPGVAYLSKPFTAKQLATRMREVLDSPAPQPVGN